MLGPGLGVRVIGEQSQKTSLPQQLVSVVDENSIIKDLYK